MDLHTDYRAIAQIALAQGETTEGAETRGRTGDLQMLSLTLSQLTYHGLVIREVCRA